MEEEEEEEEEEEGEEKDIGIWRIKDVAYGSVLRVCIRRVDRGGGGGGAAEGGGGGAEGCGQVNKGRGAWRSLLDGKRCLVSKHESRKSSLGE